MGLKWLRDQFKHLKWVLWLVIIVFVALVFVDWGAGRKTGGGVGNAAIRVADRTVSEQEFLRQVKRSEEQMRAQFGQNWDRIRDQMNMGEQTAERMIQRELLLLEAERLGLRVPDEQLARAISELPVFQDQNGAFVGMDRYRRILRVSRTTPEDFENDLREDLLLEQLTRVLTDGVVLTDEMVEEEYRRRNETVSFETVVLMADQMLGDVEVSDAEVAAYYDEHADDYERAEQRVLRYLLVDSAALRRLLPVDDAEIEAYYRDNQEEFLQGEQAHARHILIKVAPDAPEAVRSEAKLEAEGIAKIARSGADFAELAQQHSEDAVSAADGGDLGWFGRGQMVESFQDAVFTAKPGDIVGPVESEYGYHVIKVEGFKSEHVRPLEEVVDQVRFNLLEGRAAAEAQRRARALADRVEADPPTEESGWQALADEHEAVSLNQTPPFELGEVIPGVGRDSELAEEAFADELNGVGGPRATTRGWIVWQVAEIQPAGVPPLDEIRAQVTADVRRERALAEVGERGRVLVEQWSAENADATVVAEAAGGSMSSVNEHRRGTTIAPLNQVLAPLDSVLFAAEVGDVVGPVEVPGRGVVVAKVTGLDRVEASELAANLAVTRDRMRAERGRDLLQSIVNERRREEVVTVNQQLVDRFAPATG